MKNKTTFNRTPKDKENAKKNPFERISKELIFDERLSVIEIGIMSKIFSLSKDWIFNKESFQKKSGIGEFLFNKLFDNLKEYGYIEEIKRKDEHNIIYWDYVFNENPMPRNQGVENKISKTPKNPDIDIENPTPRNQGVEISIQKTPQLDFPPMEEPSLTITIDEKNSAHRNRVEEEFSNTGQEKEISTSKQDENNQDASSGPVENKLDSTLTLHSVSSPFVLNNGINEDPSIGMKDNEPLPSPYEGDIETLELTLDDLYSKKTPNWKTLLKKMGHREFIEKTLKEYYLNEFFMDVIVAYDKKINTYQNENNE